MMCGYTREDLGMLTEKDSIQIIDGFLVLAEEPEKRGNPEVRRWAKRLREFESATDGSLTVTTIAMPPKNSSTPPISSTIPMR